MRRALTLALLSILALATILVAPPPMLGTAPAAAAGFMDLGGDDTLVMLTPWETAWMANALDNDFKWDCAPPTVKIKVPRVVKFFNKFCHGYKGYSKIAYWRVKTFLKFAVLNGGCGAFVLDGARWRPTRARPATTWSPAIGGEIAHTWTHLGQTSSIKTKNGWTKFTCREYRFPDRESNIIPVVPSNSGVGASQLLPAAPALPNVGGG
ncbi:MAG: hypothetical protein ACRDV9_04415 [Acidimicrobiia bacterium]